MGDDRFHARSKLPFSRRGSLPAILPGKTKETAGMYHHGALPQEIERGFFLFCSPGITAYPPASTSSRVTSV